MPIDGWFRGTWPLPARTGSITQSYINNVSSVLKSLDAALIQLNINTRDSLLLSELAKIAFIAIIIHGYPLCFTFHSCSGSKTHTMAVLMVLRRTLYQCFNSSLKLNINISYRKTLKQKLGLKYKPRVWSNCTIWDLRQYNSTIIKQCDTKSAYTVVNSLSAIQSIWD